MSDIRSAVLAAVDGTVDQAVEDAPAAANTTKQPARKSGRRLDQGAIYASRKGSSVPDQPGAEDEAVAPRAGVLDQRAIYASRAASSRQREAEAPAEPSSDRLDPAAIYARRKARKP